MSRVACHSTLSFFFIHDFLCIFCFSRDLSVNAYKRIFSAGIYISGDLKLFTKQTIRRVICAKVKYSLNNKWNKFSFVYVETILVNEIVSYVLIFVSFFRRMISLDQKRGVMLLIVFLFCWISFILWIALNVYKDTYYITYTYILH